MRVVGVIFESRKQNVTTTTTAATAAKCKTIGLLKRIKGSCEQLMDECILVPRFRNESSCETFHIKMSLIIVK